VVVETKNVDGFTLPPEPAVTAVTIDGSPMRSGTSRAPKPPALSYVKTVAGWRPGQYRPSGKGPGSEGPIAAAVAGRPIYVYGSLGTRTAVELDERRKLAEQAAVWSTAQDRVDIKPPVKADSEVTDADVDGCDLVLFGTAETNSVVARLAHDLPLALDPGAADYGLLFVARTAKHYALVSSGLPWWTGAADAGRPVYRFAAEPLALLATFGDYILFKGSLGHVVVEGRFDRNWKLPAEAAARMSATGTVTIR
jgi:hypothetical protein